MNLSKMKPFWIAGAVFGVLFVALFSIRTDVFHKIFPNPSPRLSGESLSERNTWMNIFQNGRKIGFSHSAILEEGERYHQQETVFMRINTLGMVQDVNLRTEAMLNSDFTLSSIHFEIRSGLFNFVAEGTVSGDLLPLKVRSSGDTRIIDIKFEKKPYITASVIDAARAAGLKPGETFFFDIFDPSTMSQEIVSVNIVGKETVMNMGIRKNATRVSMTFKGAVQSAWIGEDGEVLKQEGLLGIVFEKTTRNNALFEIASEPSNDLTKVASVESNMQIDDPTRLDTLTLEISGISYDDLYIDGGRQRLDGNILVIRKESLDRHQASEVFQEETDVFLKPTLFIQSDHEKIRNSVKTIVSDNDTRLEKAEKLMDWIRKNIEKRPVLSVPDAISTLENRVGDCNEHAVLFAALARAAGIPARVEAGLVYTKGRFYYHAWNLLYLDKWVTADSILGQMPADVTHIRLASGEQGGPLDMMGVIGKIKLKVVELGDH